MGRELTQVATDLADIRADIARLEARETELRAELNAGRNGRDAIEAPGVTVRFAKNPKRNVDEAALKAWVSAHPKARNLFTRLDTRSPAFGAARRLGVMSSDEENGIVKVSHGTPKVTVEDERPEAQRGTQPQLLTSDVA